ncbi:MAG: CoA transferase [Pseudomonadota bacterium]
MTDKVLFQVKILDFSHLQQDPFASQLLADMGADVIKIECPAAVTCSAI